MADDEIIKLYKYKPIDKRTLEIILTKKIWVPKPESFNDPFDCRVDFIKKMTKEEKKVFFKKTEEKIRINYIDHIEERMATFRNTTEEDRIEELKTKTIGELKKLGEDFGVISLSKTSKSILMWSHYADRHKGICLEFSIPHNSGLKIEKV